MLLMCADWTSADYSIGGFAAGDLAIRYNYPMLTYRAVIAAGVAAAIALAAFTPGAAAQQKDPTIDLLLQSMVISVEIPLPSWEDGPAEWKGVAPDLRFLRRTAPELGDTSAKFLKDEKESLNSSAINSLTYGKGTRYNGPRATFIKQGQERTSVSFYLDLYKWGFEYINNLSTVPSNTMKIGSAPPVYQYRYTKEEGIAKAKEYIDKYTPGVGTAGAGFGIKEDTWFEHEGESPFVYRLTKTYNGVPLVDDYIQVSLDGDKYIVSISYFWSQVVEPYGDTYTAIDAGQALQSAKLIALDDFNNQPPPLTLFNMRLGYVNYRKDPSIVFPVWLLDCRWQETVRMENPGYDQRKAEQRYLAEVVKHDYLIGVDAFFATKVELVPPSLR
jgi:hypothetical protein